ncbi:MAG: hypothetical protein BWY72_01085 [Bacteroidetes bacterium ADurb.Bin416]|nr:MAG: hypothetical protein BWY72_01085 [Bacteroidetes bacterium ADurb.Bin416]
MYPFTGLRAGLSKCLWVALSMKYPVLETCWAARGEVAINRQQSSPDHSMACEREGW